MTPPFVSDNALQEGPWFEQQVLKARINMAIDLFQRRAMGSGGGIVFHPNANVCLIIALIECGVSVSLTQLSDAEVNRRGAPWMY